MNPDLYLAILAMDAYNRGYGQGVDGLSNAPNTQLGETTILTDSIAKLGDAAMGAGFYAVAYNVSGAGIDGLTGTVISYRGTDANFVLPWSSEGSDLLNGYSLAIGDYNATQAQMAVQFYQDVTGFADGVSPFDANVTTTGHSLGGGLAGYIARLYGQSGTIFDNMTFELAASLAYEDSATDSELNSRLYGDYEVQPPTNDNLTAFATTGEFLTAQRVFQSLNVNYLDSNGGVRNPFTLHSMSLQVALQFARANPDKFANWSAIGKQLWDAYFSSDVANAIPGAADRANRDDASGAMGTALAYSALPIGKGTLPFGDTGIWSMFNDASDLGNVMAGSASSFFSKKVFGGFLGFGGTDVTAYLADLLVQYAGALAIMGVKEADGGKVSTPEGGVDVREGILKLSDGILTLDTSSVLWKDALGAATKVDPLHIKDFREVFFEQSGALADISTV